MGRPAPALTVALEIPIEQLRPVIVMDDQPDLVEWPLRRRFGQFS